MSKYSYTGPYFEVPGILKNVETKSYFCSEGCAKKHTYLENFCSSCGHAVKFGTVVTKDVLGAMGPFDPPEELTDVMFMPEVNLQNFKTAWIPNKGAWGIGSNTKSEVFAVEFTAETVEQEMARFKAEFSSWAEVIEKTFNVTPIARFGVIAYYL